MTLWCIVSRWNGRPEVKKAKCYKKFQMAEVKLVCGKDKGNYWGIKELHKIIHIVYRHTYVWNTDVFSETETLIIFQISLVM